MKNKTLSILLLLLMIAPTFMMCKKEVPKATTAVAAGYTAEQKRVLESIKQVKMGNPDKHVTLWISGGDLMRVCVTDGICGGIAMWMGELAGWEASDVVLWGTYGAGLGSLRAALANDGDFIPASYPGKIPYDDFDHDTYDNADNIYDMMGQDHNTLLDHANSHFDTYWDGEKVLYDPLSSMLGDKLNDMYSTHLDFYIKESDFNDFYNVLASEEGTISEKVSALSAKGYDAYYCDVMSTYFDNILKGDDVKAIIDYSKEVEAAVAGSELSDKYKRMLLGSFAIFRYSFGYWNRVAAK